MKKQTKKEMLAKRAKWQKIHTRFIRLDLKTYEKLKDLSKEKNTTMVAIIREAI